MSTVNDVLVCGGGAAGMAAAIAAARAGAKVALIEATSQLGGTVANALIHTIGGLYDSAGAQLNDGLPAELACLLGRADSHCRKRKMGRTWVLNTCPEVYRAVVQQWIGMHSGIDVRLNTNVVGLSHKDACLTAAHADGPRGTERIEAQAVVDATGTAEIVRLFDPALLQSDPRRAAGGLIFSLNGVVPGTLTFPQGLSVIRALQSAAAVGALPSTCAKCWVDSGVREDEAYVKLFVPLPEDWRKRVNDLTQNARATAETVFAFLRHLPGFAKATVQRMGCLGVRDGGRIRGEYCLTSDDVRSCRRFSDAACRCAWPVEYWDPERGVSVEYLPEGRFYDIPLQALKVQGVANLWAAGKCLSADRLAHASARVAGTCWAMGEAVGKAAARRSAPQPLEQESVLAAR